MLLIFLYNYIYVKYINFSKYVLSQRSFTMNSKDEPMSAATNLQHGVMRKRDVTLLDMTDCICAAAGGDTDACLSTLTKELQMVCHCMLKSLEKGQLLEVVSEVLGTAMSSVDPSACFLVDF